MQYTDKRTGESVNIEKIDTKVHNVPSYHCYHVTDKEGNFYISEERLNAQFKSGDKPKEEKIMNENSPIL